MITIVAMLLGAVVWQASGRWVLRRAVAERAAEPTIEPATRAVQLRDETARFLRSNEARALLVGGRIGRPHPRFDAVEGTFVVFRPSHEATCFSRTFPTLDADRYVFLPVGSAKNRFRRFQVSVDAIH